MPVETGETAPKAREHVPPRHFERDEEEGNVLVMDYCIQPKLNCEVSFTHARRGAEQDEPTKSERALVERRKRPLWDSNKFTATPLCGALFVFVLFVRHAADRLRAA